MHQGPKYTRSTPDWQDPQWMIEAKCADIEDLDYFEPEHYMAAVAVCCTCPVINDCANYAIHAGITEGVWGGLVPRQLERMGRGRVTHG